MDTYPGVLSLPYYVLQITLLLVTLNCFHKKPFNYFGKKKRKIINFWFPLKINKRKCLLDVLANALDKKRGAQGTLAGEKTPGRNFMNHKRRPRFFSMLKKWTLLNLVTVGGDLGKFSFPLHQLGIVSPLFLSYSIPPTPNALIVLSICLILIGMYRAETESQTMRGIYRADILSQWRREWFWNWALLLDVVWLFYWDFNTHYWLVYLYWNRITTLILAFEWHRALCQLTFFPVM